MLLSRSVSVTADSPRCAPAPCSCHQARQLVMPRTFMARVGAPARHVAGSQGGVRRVERALLDDGV